MASPTIRADYDQLKDAANRFSGQAQEAQKMLQSLQREMDVLQGGDWVGTGATAFYREMGGQVLPTLKRLTTALQSAQQTTLQIHQIMAQAEAEAARWLRGDGVGAATGAAAGVILPGPGDGSGSAGGSGAAGGSGSAGAPATTPAQDVAAIFKTMVETQAKIGAALGIGDALAVAFSKGAAAGLAGAPPDMRAAIMKVLEEGAVDRKLSTFSQGVRDLVNQSPTLRSEVFQLEQKGINFKTGPAADGSAFDPGQSTITIAAPRADGDIVRSIAHESGHAMSTLPAHIPDTPAMDKAEYVRLNVANQVRGEGEAQFNGAQVRAELKAAGSTDIGISGSQTAAYQAVYDDFAAGNITRDQAVDQMGTLMGNERTSTPPKIPYSQHYGNFYENDWDTRIAPTRTP